MVEVALGDPSSELRAAAPRLRCPVVFVHGERDALVPVQNARNLFELMRGAGVDAEFHVVPGAGHLLPRFRHGVVMELIAALLTASAVRLA
jgi:pimeloyl-ACP methyl ester carboxylesterase